MPVGLAVEVELVRLPPGARNFPFHSHATEWELYLIVSGSGMMRLNRRRVTLAPGDCVMCPPGDAHQIHNTGDADLLYYVVANHAPTDACHYPDSGKWGVRAIGKYFRVTPLDYYEGEE
ncbi:MAG TPA: cupin domain-containing protein [Verrucomicrobiota bacterium]|nr:cupin domain-containing protein [Verrucomicrobiota bacterium]